MKLRVFVSSPYSHPHPAVMEDRVRAAEDACAWLLREDYLPYSPIAHWHRTGLRNGLPTNANAWVELNRNELRISDAVAFLELDGWQDSQGMAMERSWAEEMGRQCIRIVPFDGSFAVVRHVEWAGERRSGPVSGVNGFRAVRGADEVKPHSAANTAGE